MQKTVLGPPRPMTCLLSPRSLPPEEIPSRSPISWKQSRRKTSQKLQSMPLMMTLRSLCSPSIWPLGRGLKRLTLPNSLRPRGKQRRIKRLRRNSKSYSQMTPLPLLQDLSRHNPLNPKQKNTRDQLLRKKMRMRKSQNQSPKQKSQRRRKPLLLKRKLLRFPLRKRYR